MTPPAFRPIAVETDTEILDGAITRQWEILPGATHTRHDALVEAGLGLVEVRFEDRGDRRVMLVRERVG